MNTFWDKPGRSSSARRGSPLVEAPVRSNFADAGLWLPELVTADQWHGNGGSGDAGKSHHVEGAPVDVWRGLVGGQADDGGGHAEELDRAVGLPRFFVQNDEVVLSAIVHNYLEEQTSVSWWKCECRRLDSRPFARTNISSNSDINWMVRRLAVQIDTQKEARLDWRFKVTGEGRRISSRLAQRLMKNRMQCQISFPVYVHGMLKTDSFAGALRPSDDRGGTWRRLSASQCRRNGGRKQTLLEVRYSPSLASAMVDALPYMVVIRMAAPSKR